MTKYEPRISKEADGGFYAIVVRIDSNDCMNEYLCHGFGKHYKTKKMALKQANKYIERIGG